jgi:hypothetical protein
LKPQRNKETNQSQSRSDSILRTRRAATSKQAFAQNFGTFSHLPDLPHSSHLFPAVYWLKFHLPELSAGINLNLIIKSTMSNTAKESSSANDLLKNSTLYREFQAEREEILRHKWIESEKAGHDVGFERALTDWIIKHRASWRKARQAAVQN